jgi:Cysteine-rich secretory protein family
VKRARTVRSLMIAGTMGAFALQSTIPASAANAGAESCFVSAINAARSSAGVAPVGTNGDLLGVARVWSGTMASAGYIFHNPAIADLAPSNWESLGENVGVGPTCGNIAQAFMASPEHRRNILDPSYSSVGLGVVDAPGGVMYVTEDFMGTGGAPAHVVPAPAPVKAAPAPAPVKAPPAPAPVKAALAPAPIAVPKPTPAPAPAPAPALVVPTAMPIVDRTLIVRGDLTPHDVPAARLHGGVLGGVVKALGAFFAK